MTLILSYKHRQEFLASPGLARLAMTVVGSEPKEPACLLKCSTLTVKYCISLVEIGLVVLRLNDGRIAYGVKVYDDPESPSFYWSVLEDDDEALALDGILKGDEFFFHLFNELVVDTAWAVYHVKAEEDAFRLDEVVKGKVTQDDYAEEVSEKLEKLEQGKLPADNGSQFKIILKDKWNSVESHYITNRLSKSMVSVFSSDEGGQQEELALWLIDGLCISGAIRSPQVHEEGGVRELSDLLVSYENGVFLIESKALNILSRDSLPDRKKLAKGTKKHIRKAVGQLVGGVKNLRRGLKVTDVDGVEVSVNIEGPPHVIVLVTDLSLLGGEGEYGGEYIKKVAREIEGYFHILDPASLLRHVQASHMLCNNSEAKLITPLMAFDYWLMERFKVAIDSPHPHFDFQVRLSE